MSNEPNTSHLSAEEIQALLEGGLPAGEARAHEEHVASCAGCSAELDGWRLLFSELEALPQLSPSVGFRERVMARVETTRIPISQRLKALVGLGGRGPSKVLDHLSPDRVQDYLEGLLPRGQVARVETHLADCPRCSREAAAWRAVMERLESLPALDPSPGFREAVLARVRVRRPLPRQAAASLWERALGWARDQAAGLRPVGAWALNAARSLRPRTRRAWALAGSVAVAPVLAGGVLTAYLATHPLLSPGSVAVFAWWQIRGAVTSLSEQLSTALVESVAAFRAYSLVELLTGSPGVATLVAGAFSLLTVLSLWVLYRNLIMTRPVDTRYAHHSI